MLGLRSGETLKNVPAHHGVQLGRKMTKEEKHAMNPALAARAAARQPTAESRQLDKWTPPVLRSVAVKGEGVEDIVAAVDRHFHYLDQSGDLHVRRRARLRRRVVEVVESRMRRRLWNDAPLVAWLDEQLPSLESGARNPFEVADALLARSGDLVTRTS